MLGVVQPEAHLDGIPLAAPVEYVLHSVVSSDLTFGTTPTFIRVNRKRLPLRSLHAFFVIINLLPIISDPFQRLTLFPLQLSRI